MSNKILNLDLSKDPIMPAIVYGRVGDDRLQTVTVNLARRDEVADLTGYDITFEGTTYNRQTKVFDSNNISSTPEGLKKGTFDYTFPNMAFAVAGKYEQAYFSIVKDGKRDSTAGFEIYVDGNADIDAPEAETIITEYNILVTELNELQKQAITELNKQQNQAINEMNQNFTAAQERIAELEVQINDLRNKIDQALTDFENGNFWTKEESFNKEESSANVIYQIVSGKKEKIVFSTNFSGKVSGSLVENANSAYIAYSTALNAPTAGTWYEFSDERYSKISDLDDIRDVGSHKVNGQMVLIRIEYDVVDILTSVYSNNFWLSQGISTLDEKVTYIKNNVSEITPHVFGFGSGPSGNRLQLVTWRPDTKVWNDNGATDINSTNQVKDIYAKHSPVVVDQYGKINILLYSYVSDGTIPSGTSIDYSELEIALNISANDYIESKIAAYHGENIATKEEALDGESNDKIMTPLRVKEVLNARENEIVTSNVSSAAFMRSGQISFMRRGPILIVNGTVTVKTAQAALTDLFVPDLGGKVPLNNAGNILAISDKAPYAKRFLISSNGGNFRTISALEADEYLAFSGSIMLAP